MEWLRPTDAGSLAAAAFWLQLAVFWLLLFALIAAEQLRPLRRGQGGSTERIVTNFAFGLANAAILAWLPVSAVTVAHWAHWRSIGVLNLLPVAPAARFAATLLVWSLAVYLLHRLAHRLPFLWRLHQVHHSDSALDLSTGLRHHPLEALLNGFMLSAVILLLGLDGGAILAYAVAAAAFALWSHANLRLPPRVDRLLRLVMLTPAAHHLHHSAARAQTDSNYGDVLIVWDRLFGTYCHLPQDGVPDVRMGLGDLHDRAAPSLLRQLLLPFPTRGSGGRMDAPQA